MLDIKRNKINGNSWYNYFFKENDNEIKIFFMGNGDLYFGTKFLNNKEFEFYISKENIIIYNLFDKLFNNFKNPEIFKVDEFQLGFCDTDRKDYLYKEYKEYKERNRELKQRDYYKSLVSGNTITWICDDCYNFDIDKSNSLQIIKEDESYKLLFRFNEKEFYTRAIRIRNSGSRYNPFNMFMMDFFRELQEYNPDYHQVHMEEYLYENNKKLIKK